MYCIDIDLTDARKAQAQVTLKEKMLETIFEAIPDLFFLMEPNGTICDYHTSNTSDLYVSPRQFIGRNMSDVLPDDVANKFKTHINKSLTQDKITSFDYELAMPSGLLYLEARISHLKNRTKSWLLFVTLLNNINQTKLFAIKLILTA